MRHYVARKLVQKRHELALSQTALAIKSGVSSRCIQKLEQKQTVTDVRTLVRLGVVLGVPLVEFLSDVD